MIKNEMKSFNITVSIIGTLTIDKVDLDLDYT